MAITEYQHINVCKQAVVDDNVFYNFKRNPDFTIVLEHTSEHWGKQYVQLMINNFGDKITRMLTIAGNRHPDPNI